MERELQPILCLADSQLLFWREDEGGPRWLERALGGAAAETVRAAYVGASNGDEPAFYSIFAAAMESLGASAHRMILSQFGKDDREWLSSADLVLLAGGDPVRGWRVFEQSGLREAITARYFAGATLVGVSAGAVQLGWLAGPEPTEEEEEETACLGEGDVTMTFRLVPAVVGVHEEGEDWRRLRALLRAAEVPVRGLGIPSGGGLVYHPDGVIEPVRHPVHEWVPEERGLRHSLLLPGEGAVPDPASTTGVH
jgi:cyanophycinase-like exopeptidase